MLGPVNTTTMGAQVQGGGGDLHMVERITNNMERSFLAGVHALALTLAGATRQVGLGHKDKGGDDFGGTLYLENNAAALKGYCGVDTPGVMRYYRSRSMTTLLLGPEKNLVDSVLNSDN